MPENQFPFRTALGLWISWSVAVLLAAAAISTLPVASGNPWIQVMHAPPLARWDAVWYRSIAIDHYSYDPRSPENNVGFYPLYPLLLRAAASVTAFPVLWIGIGISLLCLLGALWLIGRLFAEWGGAGDAGWGVRTLLLYPTAFYFASVYTESLFLLLTGAAFFWSRQRRWLLAGLACGLASLTRLNGCLVALPVAWYGIQAVRQGSPRRGPLIAMALSVAGAAGFPLFLWWRWGDPLLYIRSKAAGWGTGARPIWALAASIGVELRECVSSPARLENLSFLSQLLSAVLFVTLTARLFRKGFIAEGLYCAATLLVLFHAGSLGGMDRYVLALFPAFFILSETLRRHRILEFASVLAGLMLQTIFLHRFVHWIMVS